MSLYVLVGICWIPVVWIQIRIRNLIADGESRDSYQKLMRIWVALGVPAFCSVVLIFYLMVSMLGAYGQRGPSNAVICSMALLEIAIDKPPVDRPCRQKACRDRYSNSCPEYGLKYRTGLHPANGIVSLVHRDLHYADRKNLADPDKLKCFDKVLALVPHDWNEAERHSSYVGQGRRQNDGRPYCQPEADAYYQSRYLANDTAGQAMDGGLSRCDVRIVTVTMVVALHAYSLACIVGTCIYYIPL